MAKNQRYSHNNHIALTAPSDITSGQPVRIGQYVGVAQISAAAGERVTIWLNGSYDVDVAGAVSNEGQIVYIKADNTLSATATGNYPFGVSNGTKAAATGTLEVAPFGKITTTAALA